MEKEQKEKFQEAINSALKVWQEGEVPDPKNAAQLGMLIEQLQSGPDGLTLRVSEKVLENKGLQSLAIVTPDAMMYFQKSGDELVFSMPHGKLGTAFVVTMSPTGRYLHISDRRGIFASFIPSEITSLTIF